MFFPSSPTALPLASTLFATTSTLFALFAASTLFALAALFAAASTLADLFALATLATLCLAALCVAALCVAGGNATGVVDDVDGVKAQHHKTFHQLAEGHFVSKEQGVKKTQQQILLVVFDLGQLLNSVYDVVVALDVGQQFGLRPVSERRSQIGVDGKPGPHVF